MLLLYFAVVQEEENRLAVEDTYNGFVEERFAGMPMHARNALRTYLMEKDENIRLLKIENGELRNHIKNMSSENTDLKDKLAMLDRAVSDTLASLQVEGCSTDGKLEDSLKTLTNKIYLQEKNLVVLAKAKKELEQMVEQLRQKVTMLTESNIRLQQEAQESNETKDQVAKQTGQKTLALEEDLKCEKNLTASLKNKIKTIEHTYSTNIHVMQAELDQVKDKLRKTTSQLDKTTKERDTAKNEVRDVNERTRKLLFSLDLSGDIHADNISRSLEHARNMVYVKRRKGSLATMPGGVSNPHVEQEVITEEVNSHSETQVQTPMNNDVSNSSLPTNGRPHSPHGKINEQSPPDNSPVPSADQNAQDSSRNLQNKNSSSDKNVIDSSENAEITPNNRIVQNNIDSKRTNNPMKKSPRNLNMQISPGNVLSQSTVITDKSGNENEGLIKPKQSSESHVKQLGKNNSNSTMRKTSRSRISSSPVIPQGMPHLSVTTQALNKTQQTAKQHTEHKEDVVIETVTR